MATLSEYKCPACGGPLHFDSETQKMKCDYCGSSFATEDLTVSTTGETGSSLDEEMHDQIAWSAGQTQEWNPDELSGMAEYVCRSCGGIILTDKTTAASSCPYCGNQIVMNDNVSGSLKPDLVIPFQLDKEQAKEAFRKHLKGKKLLPKVFTSENHIDEIKGVYVPFWLYDADVEAQARYEAETTRIIENNGIKTEEKKTFDVSRTGTMSFRNIPVDASTKADDEMMESVEPFDTGKAVPFQPSYLAGYFADRYDVGVEDCRARAVERLKESASGMLRESLKEYDSKQEKQSCIRMQNTTEKYVLYPVWLMVTTWNNTKYTFAMNGQTGKFVGNLPEDKAVYYRELAVRTLLIGAAAAACLFFLL